MRRARRAGFKTAPTGIEHGTVTVIADGTPFEVTTLRAGRRDLRPQGQGRIRPRLARRRAAARFHHQCAVGVARRQGARLCRRPCAISTARRVRFVGEPARRIAEDYLRILRFFRFHAAYGHGDLDPAGLHACIAARAGLDALSRERIRMELMKLLRRAARGGDADRDGRCGIAAARARRRAAGCLLCRHDCDRNRDRRAARSGARTCRAWRVRGGRRRSAVAAVAAVECRTRAAALDGRGLVADLAHRWANRRRAPCSIGSGRQTFVDRVALAWARSPAEASDARWRELAILPERWTAPVFPLKAADFMTRGVEKGPRSARRSRAAEEAWIAARFPADAASASGDRGSRSRG